jgi:hypothetical protein
MKSLKIWHRIAIIFLVMLTANVISLSLLNSAMNQPIATIDKERNGVLYLEPLRRLRQWLPVYRRLAEADPSLVDRAANPESLMQIEQAVAKLDELDRKFEHELNTTEDFVALRTDWAELQAAISNPQSLRQSYAKLNGRIRAMIALVGDSSELMLDSQLNSYYLINTVVVDLPNGDDRLGSLLDFGKEVLGKPQISSEEKNELLVMAAALQKDLSDTKSHLEVAVEADPELAALDMPEREYETRILAVLAYIGNNMLNQKAASSATDYALVIQEARDANFKLFDAISPSLDRILEGRSNALHTDRTETIGLIMLLMLAGLIVTVWVARSVIAPINNAIRALEAPGGAEVSIVSTNRDEVSELIRAATARKPAPVPTVARNIEDPLIQENQDLKSLIAELLLEQRSLKAKSATGVK